MLYNKNIGAFMNEELKRIISIIISIISIALAVVTLAIDWDQAWWLEWGAALYFIILANILLVSYFKKYLKTYKLCITLLIVGYIVVILYVVCYLNGWLAYLEDPEKIREMIQSSGIWGILVFFLIQFAQVLFAPIPSMATTLVGVAIYGPLVASLVSIAGVLLGSFLAFFLGRVFGRKIVEWIAGVEQTKKYCDLLNKKGKYLLILMFLFPVFPDDILCLVAGVTSMSFRFFFFASIFTRPIGIFTTAYIGSGQLIPYSGWGLYVWPILILLLITLFVLCWKYQDRFEQYFINKFSELKIKRKNEKKEKTAVDKEKLALDDKQTKINKDNVEPQNDLLNKQIKKDEKKK